MLGIAQVLLLGGWSFAGLMANPTPPPKGKPASPVVAPLGIRPSQPIPPTADPIIPPPPKPGPAARQRFYLADDAGTIWFHEDPVWLQRYVLGLNQQFAPRVPSSQFRPTGSACSGGRCPR